MHIYIYIYIRYTEPKKYVMLNIYSCIKYRTQQKTIFRLKSLTFPPVVSEMKFFQYLIFI